LYAYVFSYALECLDMGQKYVMRIVGHHDFDDGDDDVMMHGFPYYDLLMWSGVWCESLKTSMTKIFAFGFLCQLKCAILK